MTDRKSVAFFVSGCLSCLSLVAANGVAADLVAGRVAETNMQLLNPQAAFWQKVAPVEVAMLPQAVATPHNPKPAVSALQVRMVHNGDRIATWISWKDPTESERIVVDSFGDQVAVEWPINNDPNSPASPMMGNVGGRVTILQWRAAFQHDLDKGEPTLRDLYPNAHTDIYPDEVLRVSDTRPYMGAMGLDNPISHPARTPVLDQMAEGWGSMTVKPEQQADGKGIWKEGQWQVVITYPLSGGGVNDPSLAPGTTSTAAFAVWEGGAREVGSRKAWSNWVPVKLDK